MEVEYYVLIKQGAIGLVAVFMVISVIKGVGKGLFLKRHKDYSIHSGPFKNRNDAEKSIRK